MYVRSYDERSAIYVAIAIIYNVRWEISSPIGIIQCMMGKVCIAIIQCTCIIGDQFNSSSVRM